ncbi:ribonuclease M5 [Paenibacillus sp. YN15]|uniref:ribonuclease M5 n=1 Tax=Paenibacillus sp. YN15 TaxID=1742774 RepID=UPI000DCDDC5E|nr:ribonuclease M5 [Paenibacillus sp. YN15]RAU95977.1 ribonuclease M5 [Paenibacillus sp. YN15]
MLKEIIVVEGKSDTAAIKRAVEAETIETGGSAINQAVYEKIRLALERRGVIIFTDPDHAGERLRRLITARFPGCKQAFLSQEDATRNGDVGIENATPEMIRKALDNLKTDYQAGEAEITRDDLMDAGLLVHPDAAARREAMGRLLGIGYANGKQFLKRCQMFQITRKEFEKALKLFRDEGFQ